MMATEATPENLATSSAIPDHELVGPDSLFNDDLCLLTCAQNITETSSHDVSSEQPLVNGTPITNTEKDEIKQDTEHVEPSVNSAEVSVSGGSDTEASKAETTKAQTDEKGHLRTSSTVKKFASFKPVSVNKTFLAAKGATTTPPSKLGDKGPASSIVASAGPSASTTLRPRLVAKSGSGLRDSTPRASTAANGSKPGAAPDASAVWNKNRPAPPPEPKRFTDEELKQRYGIHLATRLQTDEPGGKEKNWADIDDDDDDWAPETIEWTDGTKITLPQADDAPIPSPEPLPAPIPITKDVKPTEIPKSKSPAPVQQSASPTVKSSGFGSGRAGLVLKGASEKPTLVAKPPGPPTPVKSPWAPLPPVEKVTPAAIETPQNQQPQQSRFGQRDPHGFQAMPPPAKEIAADDFSRSWRDGNSNSSRELYNSQSGRYEPVNDNRRGSVRSDAHSRQPAVLQRPSHDSGGPAEPSAAFQTHRATGQDGGYGRRRTSSNVSGGSGNFGRRMSRGGHEMPPPHEMLNVRRGSLAAVSDAPSSPRNFSPSAQPPPQQPCQRGYQNQTWQTRGSPVVSHTSPQSVHNQVVPSASASVDGQSAPTSAIQSEDQVFEEQKKQMKQKRELAIKRRQEEEAREEAARKERIRIKLEAMGPPPDNKKHKKDIPKDEKAMPTQIQSRGESNSLSTAVKAEVAEGSTESTVHVLGSVHESASTTKTALDSNPSEKPSANHRPNGIDQGEQGLSAQSTPAAQQNPHQNRSSQPWQSNSVSNSERYNWAPPPTQQSSSNVWGPPPTNNRALGNGAFNPELGRLPDMQSSSRPGPIGPPNSARGNYQFAQGHGGEYSRSRPAPIGPPNRLQDSSTKDNGRLARTSPWANAPAIIEASDKAYREKAEKEAAVRKELEERGEAPEINQPIYKETWVETVIVNGHRVLTGNVHNTVLDPSAQADSTWRQNHARAPEVQEDQNTTHNQLDAVHAPQHHFNDSWKPAPGHNGPSQAPRGSRFFPVQDVRLEEQNMSCDRPGSPSPPPPTMPGHPVYDGDSSHPHVSLPRPQKPDVVVKLPPPALAPIGPPKPVSFAAAVSAPAAPATNHASGLAAQHNYSNRPVSSHQDARRVPDSSSGGWQDRINTLIGRKPDPPKLHAFAVDSSSKNALELPQSQLAATVSLPSLSSGILALNDDPITSKPAAEECFEEQEMGSLPVIKVPVSAPAAAWMLAPQQPKSLPKKFLASQVTSAEPIVFLETAINNRTTINVKMTADDEAKIVSFTRQRSNPRRGGTRGGVSRNSPSTHPRGGRGRDSSRGFQSSNPENGPTTSSPKSFNRGGHRGSRGSRPSWDTHIVPTPVHT
ncbi:hypothetical protein LSUB1_G007300 [Lachnellula subtilissima]|uniref:Uncharacterized protein n=1 Tax=Lachnellula subtilissima TaxID=602034 RepID=A0A8H8U526_9HELO|nr:hypothetical protein LSUB1_G007300 [Lachnellula subtilissima]